MSLAFGREICGTLDAAELREWLVTNGMGGYASGTLAGTLTRRYHGLLVAALKPPLGRSLLLAKLDETARYYQRSYPLYANRWVEDIVDPNGYQQIEQFCLEGTVPVWTFAIADALLEKRVWMEQGANTTYIRYTLARATAPLTLKLKALVNYRDQHNTTQSMDWRMDIQPCDQGVKISAFPKAVPFYLISDRGRAVIIHDWYYGFDLSVERRRGLGDRDDHLHAVTFEALLEPGESLTIMASADSAIPPDGKTALESQHRHEQRLLDQWHSASSQAQTEAPAWIQQLVLAADQFIVNRPIAAEPLGKTVIAGYPWFGDWGRDTMISLPGLAIATGRPDIARPILRTFARYLDQGMLPNLFPDTDETPQYNTVDAILWYFEAIRAYHAATADHDLLRELFPALQSVIEWHQRGTRYSIHLDPSDGLIYAGEAGVQLTWMDAKVGDWVVTPRIGKPVEINALWYNALGIMAHFAQILEQPAELYQQMAAQTAQSFARFWNPSVGHCYDVIDGPDGHDSALRPNQLFAVSLPTAPGCPPLLTAEQRQAIVDTCGRVLLTSHGLRSLEPGDLQYRGRYEGDPLQRDSAYHQGTVWGWLIGPFVQSHLRVYNSPAIARSFLEPMAHHLNDHGVGSLSEIFEGDAPFAPRGAFAQAWTVAETLRAWLLTHRE